MRRSLAVLALVLLAGCGGGGGESADYRGTPVAEEIEAPAFALRDQGGRRVSLADYRGRWVIVGFLYTSCPDVCPVITLNLNNAIATPEGRRARLAVLTVSVDPARDTAAAVRRFARAHRLRADYRYLIGREAELAPVWRAYHVAILPGPKGSITHSTFQLLIDPEGRERLAYDSTVRAADVAHDLALLTEDGDE
jgi:protein SCO1/2